MEIETAVAVAAAIISIFGALGAIWQGSSSRRAANIAEKQLELTKELTEQAVQPYVYADVQADDHTGTLLNLKVGNTGPTVATNITITFEPPLPVGRDTDQKNESTRDALDRLAGGVNSLSPGKELHWPIGVSYQVLQTPRPQPHVVTINGTGPFGPMHELTYTIDLSDFREALDRPQGSLHELTQTIRRASE